MELDAKHDVRLILDNCDSLGSKWEDEYLTEYAVASSCSFYPAHHITTGEGGMVSSHIKDVVDIARSVSWWGRDCYCIGSANLLPNGTCKKRFCKWLEPMYDGVVDHKYVFTNLGYNLKPLDIQGAMGVVQLKKFDTIHKLRGDHKDKIEAMFLNIDGVRCVSVYDEASPSWFGVPIICETNELKDKLVKHLETNGIQTRNYFAGNILIHPAYKEYGNWEEYPNSNEVLRKVFFVGCSPHYTNEVIEYIDKVVGDFIR
jgi:CDP-6-deoxy-D-xylo-4-hexulose-3-dehydrase